MTLAIVTATLDWPRAKSCVQTWCERSTGPTRLYVVGQGQADAPWEAIGSAGTMYGYHSKEILGVVPAFALGVQKALEDGAEIIACFHDDLEIEEAGWDEKVIDWFLTHPTCGLAGFGGGTGLADEDIYQTPYHPMQLARKDFVSNMRHAEAHGRRASTGGDWRWSYQPERVACLDGFSQIGRAEYWLGGTSYTPTLNDFSTMDVLIGDRPTNLFDRMASWGVIHHFYDGMLGCFAKRLGWEVWMLPIACHHHGGLTAVADPRYHEWANRQVLKLSRTDVQNDDPPPTGDQVFWLRSHKIGYDQFRDCLPIRL